VSRIKDVTNDNRGEALVDALDKATLAIAQGDAEGGTKGRKLYGTVRNWLTRYVDGVHDLQARGTIPGWTAGYLVDAAAPLIGRLDALIAQ